MYCNNCGSPNSDDSRFCNKCGKPLQVADGNPINRSVSESASQGDKRAKTNRSRLIVILSIAGIAIAALIFIIVTLTAGKSIIGEWYNTSLGQVIDFEEDGEVSIRIYNNIYSGDYEYNKGDKNGYITTAGIRFMFELGDGSITVFDQDGAQDVFLKAGKDFDVNDFMLTPVPEATEQPAQPTAAPTPTPAPTPEPDNNAPAPTATPTPEITSTPEITPEETLSILQVMPHMEDSFQLNPGIFTILENADLVGKWYSSSGQVGILEFFNDDTYHFNLDGNVESGTYDYDDSTDSGLIWRASQAYNFTVNVDEEKLFIGMVEYVRDEVPQN